MFIEAKCTDEVTKAGKDARPCDRLSKFEIIFFWRFSKMAIIQRDI